MLKTKRNKTIAGVVSGCVALIAVMLIVNLAPDNRDAPTAPQTTESAVTAAPITTENTPSATTSRRAVTTRNTPAGTAVTATPDTSGNAEPVVDVTLAPVEIPDTRAASIIEENDVQAAPPRTSAQTAPPQGEQRSPTETTYIDGQKYTWDPVLGWIRSSGDGREIIMDVEDDGRRYEGGW